MVFMGANLDTDNIDNRIAEIFDDFNIRADITREDLIDIIREVIKDEIKNNA